MTQTSPILYDASTDSMYVTLREGHDIYTIAHSERDYAVDIGEDGKPIGYDIQFASQHADVIAEALRLLQRDKAEAALRTTGNIAKTCRLMAE